MNLIRYSFIALLFIGCGDPQPSAVQQPAGDSTATALSGMQRLPTQGGGHMEGMMQAGVRTGGWVAYYPDGTIQSKANYSEGVEVGPTEVYHPNGQVYYSGQYTKGMPSGEWVFFDLNGQELKRVEYDSTGVVIRQ